jgi:hypothetical protein
MSAIDFTRLELTDTVGAPVNLRNTFADYALVICLRHLA